jgi:antitoxin HicB
MTSDTNPHFGSSVDEFLADEGLLDECEERALKEVLAMQIMQAMRVHGLSKAAMARKMRTSRAALDRLLNPSNTSVTLHTLQKAAQSIGKRLKLELVDV